MSSGGRGIVNYVLFHESAPDVRVKAGPHFAAHQARWATFSEAGTLLMIGTFGNPQDEGSMGVFTSREAAEEFARGDPFVLNGVVTRLQIHLPAVAAAKPTSSWRARPAQDRPLTDAERLPDVRGLVDQLGLSGSVGVLMEQWFDFIAFLPRSAGIATISGPDRPVRRCGDGGAPPSRSSRVARPCGLDGRRRGASFARRGDRRR